MRINQCEYAEARLGKFKYFLKKHNLKKYYSPEKPAIFFGMYSKLGLNTLKKHKSLAIIIWRGTDIINKKKRLESVLKIKNVNIKHIAISDFIKKDLDNVGLKYKFIPLGASNTDHFESCQLGNEVYIYAPKTRYKFYGGEYLDKVKKKCKFHINIGSSLNCYTKKELHEVYKRSFIGLRLTQHDGIANQVIEMGLMGRKCIHNGNHPNCIRWKNSKSILKAIEKESQCIGQVRNDVSFLVKNYIDIGQDWLDTNFWL